MNNYSPDYYDQDTTAGAGTFAIDAIAADRATFIRKTYAHLAVAILLFMGLEFILFSNKALVDGMMQAIGGNWWLILIAFMGASWIANSHGLQCQISCGAICRFGDLHCCRSVDLYPHPLDRNQPIPQCSCDSRCCDRYTLYFWWTDCLRIC